ncbi:MAG: hypothetical protein LUO93_04890 [Methanomicrobiales archaeon]|nr:hypothetical protein [Methanomicrobiales archaeon]
MIGATFAGAMGDRGKIVSMITGIVLSGVFFGAYHLGHSPPFNQPAMIAFLSGIGVLTGLVYFVGRDIYATWCFITIKGLPE